MTTLAPSSMSSGSSTPSSSSRPGARSDRRNTRAPVERTLQAFEYAYHTQAAGAVRDGLPALADALGEVMALDAQRLLVGDVRTPHVARAGDVLAVGAVVLVEALVVDDELLLE